MKYFVISQAGLEYNDSTYDIVDTLPVRLFTDEKEARKVMIDMQKAKEKEYKENDIYIEEWGSKKYPPLFTLTELELTEKNQKNPVLATKQNKDDVKSLEGDKKTLANKIKELDEELYNLSGVLFEKKSKEFFDKYPELKCFSWTQYTPHFNDGDPCHFSVHEVHKINDRNRYRDSEMDKKENEDKMSDKLYDDLCADLTQFVRSFDKKHMERLFDDGYEITVTNDNGKVKIEKEWYNHD